MKKLSTKSSPSFETRTARVFNNAATSTDKGEYVDELEKFGYSATMGYNIKTKVGFLSIEKSMPSGTRKVATVEMIEIGCEYGFTKMNRAGKVYANVKMDGYYYGNKGLKRADEQMIRDALSDTVVKTMEREFEE